MTDRTRTWTWMDKRGWGEGPWDDEPDKVEWTDEVTGLTCLIVRATRTGALCGYVGIGPEHPYHGTGWEELKAVKVHGGLNYSAACDASDPQHGVCHVPHPGQPDSLWWLGFDTSHYYDAPPLANAADVMAAEVMGDIGAFGGGPLGAFFATVLEVGDEHSAQSLPAGVEPGEYRNLPYVRAQCAELARQVAAVGSEGQAGEADDHQTQRRND